MLKLEKKPWVIPLIVIISALIFALDLNTKKGSSEYIFYFIPVALTFLHSSSFFPFLISTLTTLLSITGYLLSPVATGFVNPFAFQNRLYTIFTLWIVASLVSKIISSRNENLKDARLKTLASQLQDSVRGELSTQEIGKNILSFLSKEIHSLLGVIYIKEDQSSRFQVAASSGVDRNLIKDTILSGEGINGQVIIDQKIVNLSELPDEHLKLKTSLGESSPGAIMMVPLVADGISVGLLELAFREPPNLMIQEFFKLNMENLAIAIRSAMHKSKLVVLLQQAQQYSQELQAQQEELRVSNEELEQQSNALKESHARLENQQAELEQSNQQLEEQSQFLEHQKSVLDEKNRSLERAQIAIEEKGKEIEKSSQYKSEFLANMSHELRTPLNSTLILAKLLSENKPGNLNEEQVKYAHIIYNSGNDLLSLINDILDLSKVEAGKMTVHPEIISLHQVNHSLEQMFVPVAANKKIEFKVILDPKLPSTMTTDRQRLEQILRNFLSNAFKFTTHGTVTLSAYPENGGVSFAVKDTGLGITPEQQKVIFEAFRQADGTTNRRFGGTGLGLSISKELSHLLNGEIHVESRKDEGSTFILNLPFDFTKKASLPKAEVLLTSPPVQPKQDIKEVIAFSFEDDRKKINSFPRKMLIVEDEEAFAKILFDLAHELKFGAIVANTGEEALKMASEYSPHAIVLDVRLPDHSGMIVLDQLKSNPKTRHIPVHMISSEDFSRSALEMGAMGYLQKPVKKEQLKGAFEQLSSVMEQKLKRVLVVEDDEIQRNHIVGLISDSNVEVEAVETSKAALEKLAKRTYDCMIMDLSLPDMTGHELLAKLSSENSVYSYPPVIVYTARDLTVEEEERLRVYSGSIIIKGAKSPERLLSEVTLFLHKVETELPPDRQKMLKDLRNREKNLEERKILLVDDDVRNIFALVSALESYGAKTETARNGREALEKIQKDPEIDLVLMDIMMPEMDGYEAMRRIRQMPLHKNMPIIALTAKAMSDDREKCLEAGANDYLPKPIVIEKLLSLLRVWLPPKRRFIS